MPNEQFGKAGTITEAEFDMLSSAMQNYGGKLLAAKVAKICTKRSAKLLHENTASLVGNAYKSVATKITSTTGNVTTPVSRDVFAGLEKMIDSYGAEVVVNKLGKIAARRAKALREEQGSTSQYNSAKAAADALKGIFGSAN